MISFILRLIDEFKQEHGYQPNLLYLNKVHFDHLRDGFSEQFTVQRMCEVLQLELVIDSEVIHPHVVWTLTADKLAV